MFSGLKPIPRFILIAAIIGGVTYGIYKYGIMPKAPAPVVPAEAAVVAPVEPAAPVAAVPAQVAPVPAEPTQSSNAGLDAVLKQGARK